MAINIPQSVFDKFNEVIDSTFDIFGVTCQLVSLEKKEIMIDNPDDNLPIINTINDHRRGGGDRNRGTKVIKEVETITDISLKVYWDNKQWVSVAEDLVIPDASIQTIAFFSDFEKIMSAKELIVHKGIKSHKEMRFKRVGEHIPVGLKQNRYFACYWKRVV